MTLRSRIFLVCWLGLAIGAPSVLAQQKAKLRQVRMALPSQTIGATHYYVRRSLGLFDEQGLDLQILVLEPRPALAALLTGDLDFYTATGTSTRAALRGVPVRVALVGLNRPDHVLVASKEISSVEQLRGKVIGGFTRKATANIVFLEFLVPKSNKTEKDKVPYFCAPRRVGLRARHMPT